MSKRVFTAQFKAQVALEVISGSKSPAEICRAYSLHPQVVNRWKSQVQEQAHTLFERSGEQQEADQRLAELERLVGRLTVEAEAAKKACSSLAPRLRANGR